MREITEDMKKKIHEVSLDKAHTVVCILVAEVFEAEEDLEILREIEKRSEVSHSTSSEDISARTKIFKGLMSRAKKELSKEDFRDLTEVVANTKRYMI